MTQKEAYYAQSPPRAGATLLVTTLAYTGHVDEAAAVLAEATQILAATGDRSFDNRRRVEAARLILLAQRGDKEAAIDGLRTMMAEPGALTVHDLRAVKYYFPTLRDDPRFQALLRGEGG